MAYPHCFPSLTENDGVKPVLLVGAGLSNGIVPGPKKLTDDIHSKHTQIENQLGCHCLGKWKGEEEWNSDDALYQWAEDVVNDLAPSGSPPGSRRDAKRRLAEETGIANDPRFHGKVDVPLRGNTPRHRVIARFAREGRWYSFWCLNWDCLIEVALESVGLEPIAGNHHENRLPWAEWYLTWVPDEDIPPRPDQEDGKVIHLIKPHGCVRKLANGKSSSFKICKSELEDPLQNTDDITLFNRHIQGTPLIACGWSGQDKYLIGRTEKLYNNGDMRLSSKIDDGFSLINRSWYAPHKSLANCYGKDRFNAFFEVGKNGKPSMDSFFLWLQTRFGLGALKKIDNCSILQDWLEEFTKPQPEHWINHWFDNFLPVWLRLCFNIGWMKFVYNSQHISVESIPTDRRDEHIPWSDNREIRKDLTAALRVLLVLEDCGDQWDYGKFPGGFWWEQKGVLILPLPYFDSEDYPTLSPLKQLVERRHWEHHGMILELKILPINENGVCTSPTERITKMMKQRVASLMKVGHFADPRNIHFATVADLGGAI